jgi:hypothetical protein
MRPDLRSRRARVLIASVLFVASGGLGFAGVRAYLAARQIKPLLPAPDTFACFEGTFTDERVDIDDWSKRKHVYTGRKNADGSDQYTIEFERTRDVAVAKLALRLDYDHRKADYDWIYNFTLVGNITGLGTVHARGECPWYETSSVETSIGALSADSFRLGCGIDCDGGSMSVWRVPGTGALKLVFGEYGLRMKLGCGGGGRGAHFNVRTSARGHTFKLNPAPQSACQGFEKLD